MTRDDVIQEFGWYEHEGAYREAVWDMADEIVRLRSLTPPPAPRVVVTEEDITVARVLSMTDCDGITVTYHSDGEMALSATDDDGKEYTLRVQEFLRALADADAGGDDA